MKLYDLNCVNRDETGRPKPTFVWPCTPKNYRPGQPTSFVLTKEPSAKAAESQGYTLAGPCQLGMYDEDGFYHTYKPPIEGICPGKYVRVLDDEQAKSAKVKYESDQIYARHGGRKMVGALT
tara:strand:+ start:30 stop:395 length:366 start_codon:yes stop_codon:yes gene_type:complete